MTERRYRDGEVRKILELATRSDAGAASAAEGLTLGEIQSIALEVGVAPEAVSSAAASLALRPAVPPRRSWGMPIEVGRTIALPRSLTDHEWDQLVAELRATFRAKGRVVVQGGLREWSNGRLHACIEPAGQGYRLRLGTVKGDAAGLNAFGAIGVGAGAIIVGAGLLTGGPAEAVFGPAVLAASGAGAFLANLLRLPRWARLRARQMDHIEASVRAMVEDRAVERLGS
jgi:hypothetical protein